MHGGGCTGDGAFVHGLGVWERGLFVCYVALRRKSTAMVMAGWSVHQTTLSWASLNKQLTSTSCTYFGL